MEFSRLIELVGDEPVFRTEILLAGAVDPNDVRRQLSRWVSAGRLYQLRRGVYALMPPFQRVRAHPFVVANRMVRGSYVSLHSALAYCSLIPEGVPVVTSVSTSRPGRWNTPLGSYEFRHIKIDLFFGYHLEEVSPGQRAFVAMPEKALLDLAYLHAGGDNPAYLRELRLQNLERLDLNVLCHLAERTGKPKLRRMAAYVGELANAEAEEYEPL